MFGFMPLRFRAEEGGGGPDVDSVAGFHEAVITAAGGELTDEARQILEEQNQDRSVASGLVSGSTTEEESSLPAPQSASEPVAEEGEEGAAPPEEAPAPEPSPLEKQLSDSQSFIGRQAEVIGELRARVDTLEKERQGQEEEGTRGEDLYIPDESGWERLTDQFDNLGGPGLMSRVATSAPEQVEAALALWKAGGDTDVASAYLYEAQVNRLLAEQEGSAQPTAPELPEEVQGIVAERRMQGTFQRLSEALDPEVAKSISPHIETALTEAGPLTQQALANAFASDDPKQHEAAFNEVVKLATIKAGAAAAPAEETKRAAAVEAKRRAQVATGSGRPAASGKAGDGLPTSLEEFEAAKAEDPARAKRLASALVAKQFESAETTSVAEGLKQGRGQ